MAQFAYDEVLDISTYAIDFRQTSFFLRQGQDHTGAELPLPSAVRAKRPGNYFGIVTFPEMRLLVKYGPEHKVAIHEAQTLQALRRAFPNNDVLAPELLGWRSEDDINYLYMSLMPGVTLDDVWTTLSNSEKEHVVDQLRESLSSLRSLRPTEVTLIGSISGGRVQDIWFRGDKTAGPFRTAKEFNDHVKWWSLDWLPLSQRPPDPMRALLADDAEVCFAHADLHLQDLLVDGEPGQRRLSAIVDWGQAGWYPECWDYCKAVLMTGDHEFYTDGWLAQTLPPYFDEYDAYASYWQCKPL